MVLKTQDTQTVEESGKVEGTHQVTQCGHGGDRVSTGCSQGVDEWEAERIKKRERYIAIGNGTKITDEMRFAMRIDGRFNLDDAYSRGLFYKTIFQNHKWNIERLERENAEKSTTGKIKALRSSLKSAPVDRVPAIANEIGQLERYRQVHGDKVPHNIDRVKSEIAFEMQHARMDEEAAAAEQAEWLRLEEQYGNEIPLPCKLEYESRQHIKKAPGALIKFYKEKWLPRQQNQKGAA